MHKEHIITVSFVYDVLLVRNRNKKPDVTEADFKI